MVNEKLVSVIIPVYNGERYLSEAIDCIRAQEHRPIEIIMVNDGSTDNTETVAGRYSDHIIYARQENRGPAAARNRGLQMSHGDFISFLDADDLWSENKLLLQLAILRDNPETEFVLGLSQPMKLQEGKDGQGKFEKWHDPYCALCLSAALFRKSVFEKVGIFDESLRHGEDVDWFMRAWEQGVPMTVTDSVTLFYRWHGSNMSLNSATRNKFFIRALKKSLDRRRQHDRGPAASLPRLFNPPTK